MNMGSQMVKDIQTSDIDVTPSNPMSNVDDAARTSLLLKYGGSSTPFAIFLYPTNFEEKEQQREKKFITQMLLQQSQK